MNIHFSREIYDLQSHGGISTIWDHLLPLLKTELPEATWNPDAPCDIFLPSYYGYGMKPEGSKSVVLCYDYLAQRYPLISRYNHDSEWKYAAVAQANAVIAISQWTADDVKRFQNREASVAYPATTLTRTSHERVLAFRDKYKIDYPYVLVVGRRGLYKNFGGYVQALRLIREGRYFGTLCAGGEETFDLTPDDMRFIQPLTRWQYPAEDLAAAYTGAVCLMYPSLYEGFGLPVLEAYSCGCPVICGNGGALAEINDAACVVDVMHPREIAEALMTMQDHSARIEYILKGYETVKRFSWEAMAQHVASVIRNVSERIEA